MRGGIASWASQEEGACEPALMLGPRPRRVTRTKTNASSVIEETVGVLVPAQPQRTKLTDGLTRVKGEHLERRQFEVRGGEGESSHRSYHGRRWSFTAD